MDSIQNVNVSTNEKKVQYLQDTKAWTRRHMLLIIDQIFITMNTVTTGQIFISINTGGLAKRTTLGNVLES